MPALTPATTARTAPATSASPFQAIVAGAGPAALEAVLALDELARGLVDVTLVAPGDDFVLRPVSVVEPFALGRTRRYPLEDLLPTGVRRVKAGLIAIDADARELIIDGGERLPYDALVVATGAAARAVPHALTFRGPGDAEALHGLVRDLEGGYSERVAFVAPPGASWTLPLYELALQAAARADDLCLDSVSITVMTWESRPLEMFGPAASALVERLLGEAGIELLTDASAAVHPGPRVTARRGEDPRAFDRVVALPRLEGRRVRGLPSDASGFIPVDDHGAVRGCPGVYAAGDGTDVALKQGGIATQLAGAVAASIAHAAGCRSASEGFRPVLRALLFTGGAPWFLRRDVRGASDADVSSGPLWWPPAKIAGRHLAPRLDALDAEAVAHGAPTPVERRWLSHGGAVRRRAVIASDEEAEHGAALLDGRLSSAP